MTTAENITGERVKERREAAGLSQPALARLVGMSQTGIADIEKGRSKKPGKILEIAEALQTTAEYLKGKVDDPSLGAGGFLTAMESALSERGSMTVEVPPLQNARIGSPVIGFTRIPVRGRAMGGKEGVLIFSENETFGEVAATPNLVGVPDAYAVYVVGNSMMERFRQGEVVFVHPYQPVRPDDDVVLQVSRDGGATVEAYIKRFVSDDGKVVKVRQLNPAKVLSFSKDSIVNIHRIVGACPA